MRFAWLWPVQRRTCLCFARICTLNDYALLHASHNMTPTLTNNATPALSSDSSLLIVYSGLDPELQADERVEVRLIDFAQVITPLSSAHNAALHRYGNVTHATSCVIAKLAATDVK